jgi:tRNA A37 N6-isopentenylltransferase MiaA
VLDGWDLTGTGTLRRSLERDFSCGDVKGAYQVLARLAPEVARRVHPGNYEVILNALVRRMAGEAGNEVAALFAFAVYGVDRGKAETDRRIETTLDAQIRDGLPGEIAELDRRYRLIEQARGSPMLACSRMPGRTPAHAPTDTSYPSTRRMP